jgi:pimeloyl-ACP methyl ester carboxylesterase
MHSIIGASLKARMFPKIMRFQPFRHFIHWMIYQPWMRKRWEQRLFLKPEAIPKKLRDQFFEDYRGCAAFPVLFDLINPVWYDAVQKATSEAPFYFIWGDKERVVAAKYLDFWQKDYPNATFEVVDGWDHFPMLETAEHYYDKLAALVTS